jgi:2-polyprenyl-3-methyl-5-hydroxy-6-metoxy-1,4-benzoquinol methylase
MEKIKYQQLNREQEFSERDSFRVERYLQFARHFNPATQVILDVGCNNGMGGAVLKNVNPQYEIDGIDVVEERIKRITPGIYKHVICDSIINSGLPVEKYDAIVAGEFIEHIAPEDIDTCLASLYGALVKNGILLMTTPNPVSFLEILGKRHVKDDPSHLSVMKKEELKRKMLAQGFSQIAIYGSGKATRIFKEKFIFFNVYGSYLITGLKQ